jgi:hypothetical protein
MSLYRAIALGIFIVSAIKAHGGDYNVAAYYMAMAAYLRAVSVAE